MVRKAGEGRVEIAGSCSKMGTLEEGSTLGDAEAEAKSARES